jgi:hypothetical protein
VKAKREGKIRAWCAANQEKEGEDASVLPPLSSFTVGADEDALQKMVKKAKDYQTQVAMIEREFSNVMDALLQSEQPSPAQEKEQVTISHTMNHILQSTPSCTLPHTTRPRSADRTHTTRPRAV